MFYNIEKQALADRLNKAITARARQGDPDRDLVLKNLQEFEQEGWQPAIFAAAVNHIKPGGILVSGGNITVMPRVTNYNIAEILVAYIIMNHGGILSDEPAPRPTTPADIFDIEEAAAYLDVSVPMVKKYVYTMKVLTGFVKGRTLLFTKTELDNFLARPRQPVGRPPVKPKGDTAE